MKSKKILIVDDITQNLQIIFSIFEINMPEYIIYQANNADNAFYLARKILPDLIITDWDMPDKNGIDLLKDLKHEKITKDIPVIMATGVMLNSEHLRIALEAGAIDYIRKPINEVELISRTRSVLLLSEYNKKNIELKNNELIENALYLVKNKEFNIIISKKLQNLCKLLSSADNELISLINEIVTDIDEKIKDDSWLRFEVSFNEVNKDFNKILFEKYPTLTSSEIKICAFLKLGLNSKNIASILKVNPESIKVSRYRLRKKLNLEADQNLQMFLASL